MMNRNWLLVFLLAGPLALVTTTQQAKSKKESSGNSPVYNLDGNLKFPTQYREWVYLTSGVDMSYSPNMSMDHSMFDNVFVNPEAYRSFLQTGTWPDKTMLVLEGRVAGTKGSINKAGHFQTAEIMGREVHLKDEARFPGKWAFFISDDGVTGKLLPREMDCYSCHEQHGAVDTTFVQFYPTMLEIAKKRNTLSVAYLKEEAGK
ncbi:MAG TPA: cytochrome P460 family protein [Candidatus Sulfotelmatobacter sp.]|nr:cytochrome P460 family protein [Candidatus Sulfotelmatobacter sp.]